MRFEFWFTAVTMALVAVFALWLCFPSEGFLRARRENFSKRTQAFLDPAFTAAIDRDTRLLRRCAAALFVVNLPLAFAADHYQLVLGAPVLTGNFALIAPALAGFAAIRLRAAGREFAVPGRRSAVARPRKVVLTDYVSTVLQVATWVGVGADVLVAAVIGVAWSHGQAGAKEAMFGLGEAVAIVSMAAYAAWFGRALCERPTPAVDASHLYLQDAWRASSLGWACGLVALSASFAFQSLELAANVSWLDSAVQALLPVLIVMVLPIALIQWRWFRRRLWPTLLPGQVLLPGQPVPPRVGAAA